MSETTPIPAPTNRLLKAFEIVLDHLVEGVGVELAIAAATAHAPILAKPVIRQVFRWSVERLAMFVEARLYKLAVRLVINIQGTQRKKEFNEAIKPIIDGSPTSEEIERARRAADRLIERNR